MTKWGKIWFQAALCLALIAVLLSGCAGQQTTQQLVTTEYLLTTAGFQRLPVNMETPHRQALMINLPKGKIVTYIRDGEVYHLYGDQNANILYMGNEAAYQKYLSLARDRQLCERVSGDNQTAFWGCMVEYEKGGGGPLKK